MTRIPSENILEPANQVQQQSQLLGDLAELVRYRAQEEQRLEADFTNCREEITQRYQQQRQQLTAGRKQDIAELNTEYAASLDEVMRQFEQANEQASEALAVNKERIESQSKDAVKEARREARSIKLDAEQKYELEIAPPQRELAEAEQFHQQRAAELQTLHAHAEALLKRRRCGGVAKPADPDAIDRQGPTMQRYNTAVVEAREKLQRMANQTTAKYIEEGWPILLFIFFSVLAIYPSGQALGWNGWLWIAVAGGSGLALTILVTVIVYPFVRYQTARAYPHYRVAADTAEAALREWLDQARATSQKQQKAVTDERDAAVKRAGDLWNADSKRLTAEREQKIQRCQADYNTRKDQFTAERDNRLQALNDKYPRQIDQREDRYKQELSELEAAEQAELQQNQKTYDQGWQDLIQRWYDGVGQFQASVDAMNDYCQKRFAAWDSIDWENWTPSQEVIHALRFGDTRFDLQSLDSGVPTDPRLELQRTEYQLPALLSFPDCPSLLMEAEDDGRGVAVITMQDVMLRLLTSLPAGKVRFTIIDPTGLGQNFSAFMHLADFDDQLVTNRIWTEASHINQRLLDLTEHMEKVIQKYLRNEFESIQEYNKHAGEVAEPFQILVVANFPANFSDEAARRLVSIAGSGARCGVYTLISVDTKMTLPRNFDLKDLEARAATLRWSENQFQWVEPHLKELPLSLEAPPDDDRFSQGVKAAGRHAKDANRVEVPFAAVAPNDEMWWTDDSRNEVEVPLGRAGATKLQAMRLGKGTSQHVLISGKTGSGKSTLLHAMITSLALRYSPSEVQFYLIDFKKGVEFRPYAAMKLPHARVIAIESEREFGMSVLERLDEELKTRGDLFRKHGVQGLGQFRDANPDVEMPRVLLIIDEFQELFVKDDKLASEASLLLDRLVRQGRAFGIHVLLGSQTLAGAYSLARSTIGQMAVRIALQCSETDAHLILSEDNTAARLLSRPGEAIYNDANGLLEGNHPFQVVWLPDAERENYLQRLSDMCDQRNVRREPPIVFEGNVAADLSQNLLLRDMLTNPPSASPAPRIWLGAAVAIKEPTSGVLRRQAGSNLLMVGQQPEMAAGVMAGCLISLAAQQPLGEGGAQFMLLDGTRQDETQVWRRFASQLPIGLELLSTREAAAGVDRVAKEVDRRTAAGDEDAPPIFLCIHNLTRFRELKKSDDDFGFSSFSSDDEEQPSRADKQLISILREGPPVGVHVLVWSDTFNSATRWLDRQTLRDLEMRVLFQMSSSDSSNLMDSPEASKLGMHRGILYSEELGEFEKFRPYGLPSSDWLDWVRRQLQQRSLDVVQDAE